MEAIRSGTTGERTIRATVMALIVVTLSVYFLYDGYVGYPRENVVLFAQTMGVEFDAGKVDQTLTQKRAEGIVAQIDKGDSAKELFNALGEPHLKMDNKIYYVGPAARIQATILNGRINAIVVDLAQHKESDIFLQKLLGFGLAPFAVILAVQFIRVLTTRVVLTDAGLQVGRGKTIQFDAMTALDSTKYPRTGYVDLVYEDAGQTKVQRLDNYVIKEFQPLIEALCEHRQFPNPLLQVADDEQDTP